MDRLTKEKIVVYSFLFVICLFIFIFYLRPYFKRVQAKLEVYQECIQDYAIEVCESENLTFHDVYDEFLSGEIIRCNLPETRNIGYQGYKQLRFLKSELRNCSNKSGLIYTE